MLDSFVQVLVAVGGVTGLATPVVVLMQRRKIRAEADKVGVDAASVISDTALELMTAAKASADAANSKVDDLTGEVDALRRHVARLEHLLQDAGIDPPVFTWQRPRRGRTSRQEKHA